MKKIIKLTIILIIGVLLLNVPISVKAAYYEVEDTDIAIEFGYGWHVTTRDNPTCCEELEAMGIKTEDVLKKFEQEKIYLDAIFYRYDANDNLEMLIRKNPTDGGVNLSESSDEDVEELRAALDEMYELDICEVYENDYTYIHIEHEDLGYNLIEFITLVNSETYTISFQKKNEFTENDIEMIYEIVDSASYTIKPLQTDSEDGMDNDTNWKYILRNSIIGGIIGSAVGGAIGLVVAFIIRHNKKKRNNKD